MTGPRARGATEGRHLDGTIAAAPAAAPVGAVTTGASGDRPPQTTTIPATAWDRMRTEADQHTLAVTSPDGTSHVLELHAPEEEGNGFYGAIQLARGREGGGDRIRGLAAYSLRPLDGLALDPDAEFRAEELRVILDRRFGDDVALQDEIAGNGGRLPAPVAARLTPEARETLVLLNLMTARRWDSDTARWAAEAAADLHGIELTILSESGCDTSSPSSRRDPDRPLEQVVLYRRGGQYLAVRRPGPMGPGQRLPSSNLDFAPHAVTGALPEPTLEPRATPPAPAAPRMRPPGRPPASAPAGGDAPTASLDAAPSGANTLTDGRRRRFPNKNDAEEH
ncbi:hypothetical protein G3I76_23315 [Streptomyces sp. SID11233]|nr:hypothetical protein [Streptomyces sp. SID11233]